MNNRLHIHGAWWLRDEDLDTTINRVDQTFRRLATLGPQWGNWHKSCKTVADLSRPQVHLVGNREVIRQELLDGQSVYDNGSVDSDLGYSMMATNGPPGARGLDVCWFMVSCCKKTWSAGYNTISIELPIPDSAPELYNDDTLARAIVVLTDIWDPDRLIARDLLVNMVPPPWPKGPKLGWVNYLPVRTGVVGDLPPRWRWFDGRQQHQIFIHEGGRPDQTNSNHVDAFEQMNAQIRWCDPPSDLSGPGKVSG